MKDNTNEVPRSPWATTPIKEKKKKTKEDILAIGIICILFFPVIWGLGSTVYYNFISPELTAIAAEFEKQGAVGCIGNVEYNGEGYDLVICTGGAIEKRNIFLKENNISSYGGWWDEESNFLNPRTTFQAYWKNWW